MGWARRLGVALVTAGVMFSPGVLLAQDTTEVGDEHEVLFWLSSAYLQSLADDRGIRYHQSLTMDARSAVHQLAADCEMHVAAQPAQPLSSPSPIVVEPPNVCKRRLPGVPTTGPIAQAWQGYFDHRVLTQTCDIVGFPRIFSEHREGGTAGSSNPDHVLEIHPALSITCPDSVSLDFLPLLRTYAGMRAITDASAATCVQDRRVYVRKRQDRYDFAEEGAKGPGGRCGNFVKVEATVHPEFVRTLKSGDHSAIGWVTMGDNGPFALKLYTYNGTPEDSAVAAIGAGIDVNRILNLHGLLTYDYFTILRALQDDKREWLPDIPNWVPIPHPMALVVFGTWQ